MTARRYTTDYLAATALFACLLVGVASAEVVTYPAAAEKTLSEDYQVSVEGKPVDVYTARVLDPPFAGKRWDFGGPCSFTNFDVSGQAVVRVTSKRSLRDTVVRPQSADVQFHVADDRTLVLTLDSPRKLSIEPDGKKGPLLLFANPLETEVPKPGDPGVIHFGPGMHRAGVVTVGDGHRDGFRTSIFLTGIRDFNYAGYVADTGEILSCQMYLPIPSHGSTTADFFNSLTHHIEDMILTGRAPYPVERTLLTSGIMIGGVESLHRQQEIVLTPEMGVEYCGPKEFLFWQAQPEEIEPMNLNTTHGD